MAETSYRSKYTGAEIDAGVEKALAGGMVGPPGPAGSPGRDGKDGVQGPPGIGIPTGGTAGQVLAKAAAADYAAHWIDPPQTGATMEEVNTAIQQAVLDSWEGTY